jgi:hypothetical protein
MAHQEYALFYFMFSPCSAARDVPAKEQIPILQAAETGLVNLADCFSTAC